MLSKTLKNMKKKKSSGVDKIPMCVVVDTFDFIPHAYTCLFNMVLKQGYPQLWKLALVRPLHKAGPKKDKQNYRPISNLCSLEKLFERQILWKISSQTMETTNMVLKRVTILQQRC